MSRVFTLRKRQCNEKNKAKVLSSDWAILSNRLIFFRPISLAPKTVPEYNNYLFSNTCQALKGHQGPRDEDAALFFKELWLSEGWRRKSKKKSKRLPLARETPRRMTNSAQGYQGGLQGRGDIGGGPWRMSRVYQEKKENTAGRGNSKGTELGEATAMSWEL